jgi:hypothetical protein
MPAAESPRKTSAPASASPRVRRRCPRITRLGGLHVGVAAGVDHAFRVADENVLARTQIAPQVEAGNCRRPCSGANDRHFGDFLAGHLERVEDRGRRNDRRAMLVVVKDRDRHALLELGLDIEALRGFDVFQVDAAQGRLHRGDHVDQLVGVSFRQFDVEDIDPGEFLEQAALAFHHRLRRQRTDIAQAKHRRTVGDHTDQVGARGVQAGRAGFIDDGLAGESDAWRIGECQVELVVQSLGGLDSYLARSRLAVILEAASRRSAWRRSFSILPPDAMFIKTKARHFSRLARFTQNRCFHAYRGFRAAACQQLIAGQMTSATAGARRAICRRHSRSWSQAARVRLAAGVK